MKFSGSPLILESPHVMIRVFLPDGSYEMLDKETGIAWSSNPYVKRFGTATLSINGRPKHFSLDNFTAIKEENSIRMFYNAPNVGIELQIRINLVEEGRMVQVSYECSEGDKVENIRLLDDAFWITGTEKGYMVIPVRQGLIIPSNSGRTFIQRFGTYEYEGCHMEMLGAVKNGSALLITWHDPYVTAEVKSTLNTASFARQVLSLSMDLAKTAKAVRLIFLGRGNYASIAKAYRKIAEERGWLITWKEKLLNNAEASRLFGASNFKLWSCLDRRLDTNFREKSVKVNWTFEEVAEIAEHLKRDLKIDKVLFIIGGWIYRGYDNYHPDILPANPECGGNEKLAEASRRIKDLGYIFCLHDNYQLMTGNAPSFSEDFITKTRDGELVSNGMWAGGPTWLVCSKKYTGLLRRNLPQVKKLFDPNAYFIDQTFADALRECFDPNHPLTKQDDMYHKQKMCDYARSIFKIFGSECGREWAIPHSEFFEGLCGVSGGYYHVLNPDALGGKVIPLFEMIYRDCIAAYGKYGYDYSRAAEYVAHHIVIGRPLNYHSQGTGLYWKKKREDEPPGWPYDTSCFIRADNGWAEGLCLTDRFIKNTHEILSPLHEITAQMTIMKHEFLTDDNTVEHVVYDGSVDVVVNKASGEFGTVKGYSNYVYSSKTSGEVVLPPFGFLIESPTFIAFHALGWNGVEYDKPVLFTIRSLDNIPIEESKSLRIFHGFGDSKIKVRGKVLKISKEETIQYS